MAHVRANECLKLPSAAEYSRAMENLPAVLTKARAARGLSQREAAKQSGVSLRSWSKYENGKATPQMVTFGRIERWLESVSGGSQTTVMFRVRGWERPEIRDAGPWGWQVYQALVCIAAAVGRAGFIPADMATSGSINDQMGESLSGVLVDYAAVRDSLVTTGAVLDVDGGYLIPEWWDTHGRCG